MVSRPWVGTLLVVGLYVACTPPSPNPSSDAGSLEQVLAFMPPDADSPELEPNDAVAQVSPKSVSLGSVRLIGSVDTADTDIFALGPVSNGTRICVRPEGAGPAGMIVMLLDDRECLLARARPAGVRGDCALAHVMRETVSQVYLLVYDDGASISNASEYSLVVTLTPQESIPAPQAQVVVLNFDGGGPAAIGNKVLSALPVFDAVTIDPSFAGQTGALCDLVLRNVRARYAGLNIDIRLAREAPVDQPFSTVYFGGMDAELLGVAVGVDEYNQQRSDAAVIYTDSFAVFQALRPSLEEMAQLLANTTSHEIGHLLGLRHTRDPDDVMDITATARRMMGEQWFKLASLHEKVGPLGYQDSPRLLSWTLGGSVAEPAVGRPLPSISTKGDMAVPRKRLSSSGCGDAY